MPTDRRLGPTRASRWRRLSPIVYVVNTIALVAFTWLANRPPTEHPVIEALRTGPTSAVAETLFLLEAVLAAPILEEVFFRGILQPYLAERPWGGDLAVALAALVGVYAGGAKWNNVTDLQNAIMAASPVLFVIVVLPFYALVRRGRQRRLLPIRNPARRAMSARAIFGTALLFANFHANVWPTPIALFVLALGLGWLACRTQSVTASIVLHILFNAIVGLSIRRG